MLSPECVHELRAFWLPNMTDAGLDRLIDLMEGGADMSDEEALQALARDAGDL